MNELKQYAKKVSKMSAPYFEGGNQKLRVILIKHWGFLNDKKWGKRASFFNADLCFSTLNHVNLAMADLPRVNLSFAKMLHAKLPKADLRHADLFKADLKHIHLGGTCLKHANLNDANLIGANLSYANLSYAHLSYAHLRYARLGHAHLKNSGCFYLETESYRITGTETHLHVGCKRYPWDEDWEGVAKDTDEVEFFKKYKDQILEMKEKLGE